MSSTSTPSSDPPTTASSSMSPSAPPPSPPRPYHPPTDPSTIHHSALACKVFRVFGLNDDAWRVAYEAKRRVAAGKPAKPVKSGKRGGIRSNDNDDGNDGGKEESKKETEANSGNYGGGSRRGNLMEGLERRGSNDSSSSDSDDDDDHDVADSMDNLDIDEGEECSAEEEEKREMSQICAAIETALSDDAGGFGTAGFHVNKVGGLTLGAADGGGGEAVYDCDVIPCHPETGEEMDPYLTAGCIKPEEVEGGTEGIDTSKLEIHYRGNDKVYLTIPRPHTGSRSRSTHSRFQIRITISRAKEGVPAKQYYEELYEHVKAKTVSEGLNDVDVEKEMDENEHLNNLKHAVEGANSIGSRSIRSRDTNNNNNNSNGDSKGEPLGYYVQMMLLEPFIHPSEPVIPPPYSLDRTNPAAARANLMKSVNNTKAMTDQEREKACYNPIVQSTHTHSNSFSSTASHNSATISNSNLPSIFSYSIHSSPHSPFTPFPAPPPFTHNDINGMAPGPWEKANITAFEQLALDVRKALVRVEFPVFPEGFGTKVKDDGGEWRCKTFREVYQLNARLKSGSFATVCRGTHRATGKKIAVKCVLRKDLPPNDDAAIYDEVLILSTLRHRFICPLIDFFEERECYFLVMELMSGGDLFDRIGKRKNYSEEDARNLCRKMLESVRYCHENSVAHCDMKPKNLLLISDDNDVQVKLADFGFATRVYEKNSLTKQCGTPFFVAPEVLLRSPYDQQSDMWSVGVIIYLLLAGDLPFMGRSQKELFRKIVVGKYEFPEESWSQISPEAKELVEKLLVTEPSQRLTSREAMASSWMRQRGQLLAMNNLQYTSQRLKTFNARMKLRSALIAVDWVTSTRMSVARLKTEKSDKSMGGNSRASSASGLDVPMEEEEDDNDKNES